MCIISCNPFKTSMRFLFLFLRWEYWDSEKLKARSKITQLVTEWNLNPGRLVLEHKHVTSILLGLWGTPSPVGYFRAEHRLGWRRTVSVDKLIYLSYMVILRTQLPLKARDHPGARLREPRRREEWGITSKSKKNGGRGWARYKQSDVHIAKGRE